MNVYFLHPTAYSIYKETTVRGKGCSRYVAELKFSAMIESTPFATHFKDLGSSIYKIGTFNLVVRGNVITTLYWGQKNYNLQPKDKDKLLASYKKYGLTPDGNNLLKTPDIYPEDKEFARITDKYKTTKTIVGEA